MEPVNKPRKDLYIILEVLDYQTHYVILLNWLLDRNILCFDKSTDELVWRVNPPDAVFKNRKNFLSEIIYDKKEPDRVYCLSVDKHPAAFDIKTGKTVWEKSPNGPDFRDF